MQNEELKKKSNPLRKCPFCGGKAYRKTTFPTDADGLEMNMFSVGCETCGIEFSWLWNPEIPVELWNTRKPVENVLERLEAECIKYKSEWNTYDDEVAFGQMNGMSNAISIIKEGLME